MLWCPRYGHHSILDPGFMRSTYLAIAQIYRKGESDRPPNLIRYQIRLDLYREGDVWNAIFGESRNSNVSKDL